MMEQRKSGFLLGLLVGLGLAFLVGASTQDKRPQLVEVVFPESITFELKESTRREGMLVKRPMRIKGTLKLK